MPAIHRRPAWAIAEAAATPEAAFLNRRRLLAGMGLGTLSMAAASAWPRRALSDEAPGASYYPAKQNGTYTIDRELTPEDVASTYNNFYEFGSQKQISKAAQALVTSPWDIEIGGLVEEPKTIAFEDLELTGKIMATRPQGYGIKLDEDLDLTAVASLVDQYGLDELAA